MPIQNYRDLIGGAALIALGIFVAVYSVQTMPLGTVNRMGPGLMPFALGWILAGLGGLIVFASFLDQAVIPAFNVRPFFTVIAAILVFAVLARPFGMVLSTAAVVCFSALAEMRMSRLQFLGLLFGLPIATYLIFSYGLGVPLPLFNWPF
jgi:hypothetical protein